jgi:hypothetical protein
MIKINERFSMRRDNLQWIVTETYDGFDRKTKEPKKQTHDTFHANLKQVCDFVLDKMAGDCKDMQELKELFEIGAFKLSADVESRLPE